MAKGGVKNSVMLLEAASLIAERFEEDVCDMMYDLYDGATYCQSDCPRIVDDGCVLHLLRMRCKGKEAIS